MAQVNTQQQYEREISSAVKLDQSWDSKLKALDDYITDTGRAPTYDDAELYRWMSRQWFLFAVGRMPPEREVRFLDYLTTPNALIAFIQRQPRRQTILPLEQVKANHYNLDADWRMGLRELDRFVEEHGRAPTASDGSVYGWLLRQWHIYSNNDMRGNRALIFSTYLNTTENGQLVYESRQRRTLPKNPGISKRLNTWRFKLYALGAFVQDSGRVPTEETAPKMYSWTRRQWKAYQQGQLSDLQKQWLDEFLSTSAGQMVRREICERPRKRAGKSAHSSSQELQSNYISLTSAAKKWGISYHLAKELLLREMIPGIITRGKRIYVPKNLEIKRPETD